jgi:predicted nuclease of restriction endonuclease-like (RecB) superfamily
MVEAYWDIGRQIEESIGDRAEYGKRLLQYLSIGLTEEFGKGFTVANLRNMRQFYHLFPNRYALRSDLSWTHYRLLMRIDDSNRRDFYLRESVESAWTARQLERQINSFFYERLLATQKSGRESVKNEIQTLEPKTAPDYVLKDPYILEFSFVAQQKRITTESGEHYYIDLTFYNFILKCFVVIDLKTGKLSYQDIGQIDFYVRLFDDKIKQADDNPTIGIVLCADGDETIAKYSVLADKENLFASKYKLYLPTEEELKRELEREQEIIERRQLLDGATK